MAAGPSEGDVGRPERVTAAIVLAGGAGPSLAWGETTVVQRLIDQLAALGAAPVRVVAPDLHVVAAIAREGAGPLVLAQGDVVTQDAALACLLDDPRVATGILTGTGEHAAFPVRTQRGRVVSAGSAHHRVSGENGRFLGVLRVAEEHRATLAAQAERLAELPVAADVDADLLALLVVGLVRSGVPVTSSAMPALFWDRPGTPGDVERARRELPRHDADRAQLDAAVKSVDGFFTTFFISPWSRHLARWAARRGLTPNQITVASLAVGVLAALGFATGERWGLVAGAALIVLAFALDCVDGQLARYTRRFSRFGAWLDSIFDRAKEYVAFAGLAAGAPLDGGTAWLLAGAALTLQTVRHLGDFSYPPARPPAAHAALEDPDDGLAVAAAAGGERVLTHWDRLNRWPAVEWLKRMIVFPIGERFAVIAITAALWSARVTFIVLLAWGAVAAIYLLAGRVLRSRRTLEGDPTVRILRDDGPLARALGALGARLPAPALVTAAVLPPLVALAVTGDDASDGLVAAAAAWLVVLGGASSGGPAAGRLAWIAPPLLRLGEYAAVLWLAALTGPDAAPAAFALLGVLAFHHYDLVYSPRNGVAPPPVWLGLGWDGRLVAAVVLYLVGALTVGLWVAAGLLAVLFVGDAVRRWATSPTTLSDDTMEEGPE